MLQVELIPGTRAAVHHGCWSHDGFKFAVVDSFGCWTLFGAGLSHETYAATPTEQYFKSDYDKVTSSTMVLNFCCSFSFFFSSVYVALSVLVILICYDKTIIRGE